MSNNAHELSNRLLNALDNNYNVVDMHTVNEIISILERFNITKELLETTRLGKHVNELRRKTTEPTLARRAKVLVKRWRDLVIPTVASPGHTGSNRSSAERQVRRLGGTPLTSPALSRHVVSPAVPSPRPPSRPAWGGYESDSQDVILVDDEPPPAPVPNPLSNTHKPLTPPVKRPPSPEPLYDEKKAKRDKKPKKRSGVNGYRGHSRAGTGSSPGEGAGTGTGWAARNGTGAHDRHRNGTRTLDPYAALVTRLPPAGGKKVKTTKELLEQIQSRGNKPSTSPGSPRSPISPGSPDVMLIEPDGPATVKAESPLRNGGKSPKREEKESSPAPSYEPLEDEREYSECTCDELASDACPAAVTRAVTPATVLALHHAYLPGVNGTRAPRLPHKFAVRPLHVPDQPALYTSVVPLYKYSDYADDYCVKNMARVPLCPHLPWTEFAPPPPDLPPPPSPPPMRPYPVDEEEAEEKPTSDTETKAERSPESSFKMEVDPAPCERVKAPPSESLVTHALSPPPHRTVERTRPGGGRELLAAVTTARDKVPYDYCQLAPAPMLPHAALHDDEAIVAALLGPAEVHAKEQAPAECPAEPPERPELPSRFAEWHECARLGSLVALPYVVID